MPNITTCTDCGGLYEAGSEEQANEPERWCSDCRTRRGIRDPYREKAADGYPVGWPRCAAGCGRPALDGHVTCGLVGCDERGHR